MEKDYDFNMDVQFISWHTGRTMCDRRKEPKREKGLWRIFKLDSSQIKKLYGYRLVVIDAQYFSAKDIRTLHKKGVKVYTYLNVGSIENFRDYYKKYEYLTIGTYENWEEEKWVDVSNKDWQKFMGKLSKKLLKKGWMVSLLITAMSTIMQRQRKILKDWPKY